MRLNQDCVRDAMIFIEDNSKFGSFINMDQLLNDEQLKNKYDSDTIKYTLAKLSETDFLNSTISWNNNQIMFFSTGMITWNGHKFLDTIRDEQVWSKTKQVTKHLESISLSMVSTVATGVINHMIDKAMF